MEVLGALRVMLTLVWMNSPVVGLFGETHAVLEGGHRGLGRKRSVFSFSIFCRQVGAADEQIRPTAAGSPRVRPQGLGSPGSLLCLLDGTSLLHPPLTEEAVCQGTSLLHPPLGEEAVCQPQQSKLGTDRVSQPVQVDVVTVPG